MNASMIMQPYTTEITIIEMYTKFTENLCDFLMIIINQKVKNKMHLLISVAKVHPVAIAGYHGFLEDGI